MSQRFAVGKVADVADGGRISALVDELPVLVFRVGADFFAIEDVCSHDGQPLTDGPCVGTTVTCPRHGARFDLKTGKPLCMPATEPIATFPVVVEGDTIYVESH